MRECYCCLPPLERCILYLHTSEISNPMHKTVSMPKTVLRSLWAAAGPCSAGRRDLALLCQTRCPKPRSLQGADREGRESKTSCETQRMWFTALCERQVRSCPAANPVLGVPADSRHSRRVRSNSCCVNGGVLGDSVNQFCSSDTHNGSQQSFTGVSLGCFDLWYHQP